MGIHGSPYRLAITTCPTCGKWCYATRRDARRAARALHPNAALRPYRCGDTWHVGNTAPWRKRGRLCP